jgi:hypothetical protein
MLGNKNLLLSKKKVVERVVAKVKRGEWTFESHHERAQTQTLVDEIKAKFAPQFGWSCITAYYED